ncbi:restriction endonuclease subunit S [Pseudoalteromonas undina]|uniref:Restriction endonuclease subunit S n=1 Tax=Pseudoalteromonas undina TaxID=43660 RepID=A0ACC6R1W1_9GAMM
MKNESGGSVKTIESICTEFSTGATNALFEKSEHQSREKSFLLTGSSVDLNGEILVKELNKVVIKEGKDASRFLLKEGDIVLLAKGNSIRAAYVNSYIADLKVIASANFIILRPNPKILIGEVLVAYFNSLEGQSCLASISTGATIKNISLTSLKKLEIELPLTEKQQQIAALFHARNDAYHAAIEFAEQQKEVATACISELMKGAA